MKEKLYDIPIDHPLDLSRRKAIAAHVERNSHESKVSIQMNWDKNAKDILHIEARPFTFEVIFHPEKVEIFGSAPKWARVLFTNKRREELKQEIKQILSASGFFKI
jgi:hypothetical protein